MPVLRHPALRHPALRQAVLPALIASLLFGIGAFAAPNSQAATQILGLVASNGLPTPLQCQDGSCSGHFSSFCLQEARPAPSAESEYALAPGGSLTLIATRADGSQARLPGNGLLSLRTMIGFTSIRISLPEAKLKALGAVSVAVEVAPMTSAMPVPVANDVNPQTREEIALATGAMRHLAQAAFEDRNGVADAARLASLVINALPADEPQTPAGREAVWTRLLEQVGTPRSGAQSLSPEGIAEARGMYNACEISVASKSSYSLKGCMELRHADLMAVTNRSFWDRSGGS
jgi:hypothetical protein